MSHAGYSSIAHDYNPELQSNALEYQHSGSALKPHSKPRAIKSKDCMQSMKNTQPPVSRNGTERQPEQAHAMHLAGSLKKAPC